ncbi:MAG TPA: mechanosensitive ion channel family protein [Gemmatimonas sp.]|uniref:mechanosensitive ion channel family protein n=1 Tax=Gemmatimonas sp. TaxID=1962908 RepID=UPI002ED775DF
MRTPLFRLTPWVLTALVAAIALPVITLPAAAQLGLGKKSPPADSSPAVSTASPRAAVRDFLRLADAGDWSGAADYLAVPAADQGRSAVLARRLKSVLDQRLALDLNSLSPLVVGDTTDGDLNGDRVGVIMGANGHEEAVRLVRVSGVPTRWVFSSATVSNIDAWFEDLGAPWVRERVPPSLLREGPLNVYWWQWIGIGVALPVLVLAAWLLGAFLRQVLVRITSRTVSTWDEQLLEHLRGPFRLWAAAVVAEPLLSVLNLNARVATFLNAFTRGMVLIALFWAILQVIRIVQSRLENAAWETGQGAQARTLVPLLGNFLRVAVTVIALLVALAQFGYPVGTLLAGLGIGGIAVALAAQKTVEHLFGSVSLAADKVLRVGDWVKAGTTEGAVERIGLRSTSIRTIDRTVVRVPNGRLADDRIETFGERDRMLLRTDLDLTYETSREDLVQIRNEVEALLRAHPKVWPDVVRVNITAFTDSAIRMNVVAWFQTTDHNEFLRIRHDLFLEFLRVLEDHGSSFAFPSRTIYHVQQQDPGPHGPGFPPQLVE